MTGARSAAVRFKPFSAEFRRDPYPMYRALRETSPVHRTLGMWVLTRHADIRAVLADKSYSAALIPRLMSDQARRMGAGDIGRIERLGRKSLVFTDNPDHARLRALVNRAFTASSVRALRPHITETATALAQRAWDDGGMDVIADFARPLPVRVLCDWLGLAPELRAPIARWTHDIRFLLEPGLMRPADFDRVVAVVADFVAVLEEVVAARRARPGDDLISGLLAARLANGDRLGDEELLFVCIMCFVAGNETTTSLIGNGVLALLGHPGQQRLLRTRPDLVLGAVEEALRFDAPLQLTKRLATRDTQIAGQPIAAGDQVLLCLGAAHHDPDTFADPGTFDITRAAPGHLAFGHGMHGCLGAALAVLQARVAFEILFAGPAALALREPDRLDWQEHSFIVRGLSRLPVAVDHRS
ncbi:putative cytochrome P450 [Nocardia nova SH22a]|uniref:Putative cytochrome P450 n=1 Tax=Nocardia nova SH22a TaxID=1415166 RepID=W5TFK0_9NOCA|nr:cytochrome P450 [Nocardia nova]AHH17987.1 putative cytochrome P450 [Nocardia nova SH22a]